MSETVANNPMLWVNAYLREKIEEELRVEFDPLFTVPFFPSTPTALEDLYTLFPEGGSMCTYDRMFRMRRTPFPHIKAEQALYYFYAIGDKPVVTMIQIQEAIFRVMDREDETAEELNAWTKGKTIGGLACKFYFHRFKIYQLEEIRDIIDFGTARTYAGNKMIVDFEYHQHETIVKRTI